MCEKLSFGARKARSENENKKTAIPLDPINVAQNLLIKLSIRSFSFNTTGKCYAEIAKRNGRVLVSDMIEGSGMWMLEAVIPVIESFDLANQLRVKTSGLAMPQLSFNKWETIDQDPYWIPTTEEELEQFGDKADFVNRAKVYMDSIRERKGLYVDKKLVEFAEKQRTLSKNK